MMSSAEALTSPSPAASPVMYEHPLGERMRTFLRLESLYQQFLFHIEDPSSWSTRAAVSCMLDVVMILNRGDVRNDVLKELDRQLYIFDRYQNLPAVDDTRLKGVLRNLRQLREQLVAVGSQYMHALRENEFLSAVKHRSAIPGGACEFDLPEYSHWLRRSYPQRVADMEQWMTTIRPLCNSIAELLWLVRESTPPSQQIAAHGVYQHVLSRENPGGMLRVGLPAEVALYPEISGSHHRFTMRFMQWPDAQGRPVQSTRDVRFYLAVC